MRASSIRHLLPQKGSALRLLAGVALVAGIQTSVSAPVVAGEPDAPATDSPAAKPVGAKPAKALPFTSWEQAKADAKKNNSLIFAHFTADWCKPCKTLMQEVYPQAAIQRRLVDFARAEVDTEAGVGKTLWLELKADSLPVAAVFTADGQEVEGTRILGVKSPDAIVEVLDDALERVQQSAGATDVAAEKLKGTAKDRVAREKVRGGEWQTRDTSWLGTAMVAMVAVLFGLIALFVFLKIRRTRSLERAEKG